jgi:DNA helicase-2/ATP-dependent DNA helicase PcrA
MSGMNLLEGLNPQQQQAVTVGPGPVLVLAGPGSGKTRVLTYRIAYLIGMLGVRPYQILAVTFTNKAAREMESRVFGMLGDHAHGVTLGTFHATCARILRREAELLPFDSNFVIFDADDQLGLVRRAIDELNLDEKQYRPQVIHNSISNAKNELVLPDQFPIQTYRDEAVKRVYIRYQQLLLANNAVDFDDLLLYTAVLLEEQPGVRERYARRYEYVLVDEFQDTNIAQYLLLRHLASFHGNLFVVGDADQSIYRWRGADYRNVLRFEQDYPDTQVILLEQNYRSTQTILDVAMAVIDRHPYRKPKRLFTDRGVGLKTTLHEAYDDRTEASFVIDTITRLVSRQDNRPGDFAIMYRTNAQSRVLEEAFLHAGLPYKLVGAQRFYGRREIKDLIAFLRLVHNLNDEFSLLRVINIPPRGIGAKTIEKLFTLAKSVRKTPGEFLRELVLEMRQGTQPSIGVTITNRTLASLVHFGSHLENWRSMLTQSNPLTLLDHILEDTDYHAYIDDGSEEGEDRWENIMELRRVAAEYRERSLSEFLEEVALVSDQDTIETSASAPTLLTLHAAKGLEFPIVFIVGLNDGTLPHSRSFDDPEGMQEERRLFYVGITRAKDKLFLLYAQNRNLYGYSEPADPSRFLSDIPQELLEDSTGNHQNGFRRGVFQSTQRQIIWQPERQKPSSTSALMQRFQPGMRVQHPTWGEGMVLNSRLQDDDEIVDIFFEKIGLKRVAASLARLEPKTHDQ